MVALVDQSWQHYRQSNYQPVWQKQRLCFAILSTLSLAMNADASTANTWLAHALNIQLNKTVEIVRLCIKIPKFKRTGSLLDDKQHYNERTPMFKRTGSLLDDKQHYNERTPKVVTPENTDRVRELLAIELFEVSNEPLSVGLEVPNIPSATSDSKVIVSVISGSNQRSESLIKLIPKSGYAFIQTDKPIYTPNENVLIRMLRLDDRLRPLNQKVKLRIKNSQKVIIEETTLSPSEPKYFIDHKLEFPPAPKLGIWSAELWYGTNFSSNSSVSFEVREYVLPTFSVKIKSPKYILKSTKDITGSVQVDYVYGKPLNGTAIFKFGTKGSNGRINYFGSTSLKNLTNGFAKYNIDVNQFSQTPLTWFPAVNHHRFVVEVSVHELATGKKDKAIDESAIFVTSPYVISYKNTFYDYKPDVETYITTTNTRFGAQINDIFGESVAELPVKVILKDESGNFILNKTQTSKPSMQLMSDHLGRISFPITVGKNVKELHVSIRTEDPKLDREDQIEVAHVLWADLSASGFVYISSKSKYSSSLSVGDTYRSPLVTRGSVVSDKIYLIVVNRGHIIHSERISADKGIKFEITREMTPFIRVMILAVTRDSQLVSDSIKIEVNEDNCGLDMSVENDTKQVNPGKKLNLILNGTKGDSVALLAVDEAVYILRDSDRLTKNKLTKELVKSDMGCGPGTGLDVSLVANNVGLKIIRGEEKETNEDNDDVCIRRQLVRRKKREIDINGLLDIYKGFLRKCCLLGTWPTNNGRDCNYKATILKTYLPNDANCHEAFLQCCRMNVKPRVQAVSKFPGKFDRTRSGSEIDEYVHIAYEQDLEDKTFVRKDFRESWLFDVVLLNQSSNVLPVTFPHSITTWALSAMSLSPTNGFCILPSPLRLRTFQDIFIQISLPYSVVQSEQMEIVVTVFNYGTNRYPVLVYTYGVEGICSEAEMVGEKTKKHITVDRNSFATVTFPMVPLRKGIFDVKIVALWSNGGDVVVKKLNVVAPGITVEEDLTFQLDPKNRQRRTKRSLKTGKIEDDISPDDGLQKTVVNVEPDLTRNIVPGTRECIIADSLQNIYTKLKINRTNDRDMYISCVN
ncbi:unnamed protein product [Medioppia subpectinata]|uniref:Anaphylatoxin-like domain-containing protein n=1 Tax=Medioppia subpectinata TaxID=1979941 RepID=A0A7R9KJT8_9ACAR|nr:unnamed protein product [Medioppia subpectinata]CAG2104719.1 unnamed protein product [Medioppia subpectinata]